MGVAVVRVRRERVVRAMVNILVVGWRWVGD